MASELLRVMSGPASGTEVELEREFMVGRGEAGPGNLGDDTQISRRHARFRRNPEGHVTVEDLGSTNGTYVNGRRVTGPTVLVSGDDVRLGRTIVRFDAPGQRTEVHRAVPAPAAIASAGRGDGRPAEPPPAVPGAPGGPLPPAGGPVAGPPRSRRARNWPRRGWADVAALLTAAGVVFAITLIDHTGERAEAPTDCGRSIAAGPAYVTYTQSNVARGDNGILITPYGAEGEPDAPSQCLTGGSGAAPPRPGVTDGNDQVVVNEDGTLLFAVNQGSDSIAAFRIEPNGGLAEVEGSPFPSGGAAPASLGISADTLVVANKARDGVRDLHAETPSYTSFKIAPDGTLTRVPGSSVASEAGSAPTAAVVPTDGGVAFGLEDGGPVRGMTVDPSGRLTEAEGSPFGASPSAFAPETTPSKIFARGVRAHPTEDLVYMAYPLAPALAVYRYDDTGRLSFERSVTVAGSFPPSAIEVTGDGRFLYVAGAVTNSVAVFDLSDPTEPEQIQDLALSAPGGVRNIALAPDDDLLLALGDGVQILEVGPDGTLGEAPGGAPARLPVPGEAVPHGLAVAVPRG